MSKFLQRFGTDYFFAIPVESKVVYLWLAIYATVLIAAVVLFFILRRKDKPYRSFAKKLFYSEAAIALVGLFFVFSRFEYLRTFSWRFWMYLTFLGFVAINVWLFLEWRKLQKEILKYKTQARKDKWLKKQKKGKK